MPTSEIISTTVRKITVEVGVSRPPGLTNEEWESLLDVIAVRVSLAYPHEVVRVLQANDAGVILVSGEASMSLTPHVEKIHAVATQALEEVQHGRDHD